MDVFLREQGVYRFGRFTVDPARRALTSDGVRIKLAERLFDTLLYLVMNQGRLVERDELLQAVWAGRAVEDNNVGQAIFALRKVLRSAGGPDSCIVTVPSRGFRFAEPVVFEPAPVDGLQGELVPSYVQDPLLEKAPRGRMPLIVATLALVVACASIGLWRHAPQTTDAAVAGAVFVPPARSVAVLAFDNLGNDPSQAYLADGLSEQLINALTQIDSIQVAARISAFSYRGSHATVSEIARALNVGAVLAGSVRHAGNKVVVTAQLTNALTGFNIWSRTYDRDQNEMVNTQTDIALAVARSLKVDLSGEQSRLNLGGTTNAAAYDAYLRGMKLRQGAHDAADYRAALAEFDQAVALDPGFALAHARRAVTLVALESLGTFNTTTQHQLIGQAREAADRAVALAPMLGVAHSARGAVLGHLLLDHEGAFNEQLKAKDLEPGNTSIESNYASAALALGHVEPAVEAARRAAELDPLAPDSWGQLSQVLYEGHRYRDALEALDRERAVIGVLPPRHRVLQALVLLMMGQAQAGRDLCAAGSDWQDYELLALADHALGRQAAAAADLANVRKALGDDAASNYAEIYAQWGEKTEALRWFDMAVRNRDPGLLHVRLDPLLDPLRGEPEFKAGLERLAAAGP